MLAAFAVPASLLIGGGSLVEKFRDRYADLSSVSLKFTSGKISGSLRASVGGRYHVTLPGRILVCDGKSIWHAQSKTQTVVIDRFDAQNEAVSIERIFFVLFNVYVPSVKKKTGSANVIRLTPPDKTAVVADIQYVDCKLDDSIRITSIMVSEGGVTTTWKISDVRINPRLKDGDFLYEPPKGWQVVDLR